MNQNIFGNPGLDLRYPLPPPPKPPDLGSNQLLGCAPPLAHTVSPIVQHEAVGCGNLDRQMGVGWIHAGADWIGHGSGGTHETDRHRGTENRWHSQAMEVEALTVLPHGDGNGKGSRLPSSADGPKPTKQTKPTKPTNTFHASGEGATNVRYTVGGWGGAGRDGDHYGGEGRLNGHRCRRSGTSHTTVSRTVADRSSARRCEAFPWQTDTHREVETPPTVERCE